MAFWLEAHDAALTAHVKAAKLSFAGVAMALNLEFKTNFTRNATIGRASRLGLTEKKRPGQVNTPQPYTWKTRREREAGIARQPGWAPKQPTAKPPGHASHLRCVETTSRNISFLDLEPNDCRWTDSKGEVSEFLFCGNPKFVYRRGDVDVTSAYCRKHYGDSTQGARPHERGSTRWLAA